jgi:hypothetical protein
MFQKLQSWTRSGPLQNLLNQYYDRAYLLFHHGFEYFLVGKNFNQDWVRIGGGRNPDETDPRKTALREWLEEIYHWTYDIPSGCMYNTKDSSSVPFESLFKWATKYLDWDSYLVRYQDHGTMIIFLMSFDQLLLLLKQTRKWAEQHITSILYHQLPVYLDNLINRRILPRNDKSKIEIRQLKLVHSSRRYTLDAHLKTDLDILKKEKQL